MKHILIAFILLAACSQGSVTKKASDREQDEFERVPSSFIYYDGKGNVYERTTYSDYKFNSQGDWISRKEATEERFNRRNASLTMREIEYYPSGK